MNVWLSNFTIEETGNETFAQSGEFFSQFSIYPNPAKSHETELSIAGFERIKQPMTTEVEIIKLTGEIVFVDKISCGGLQFLSHPGERTTRSRLVYGYHEN